MYDTAPQRPQSEILGYSWPIPHENKRDVTRVRVCVKCISPHDRPDVEIVSVPRRFADRPRCLRCGIALGIR